MSSKGIFGVKADRDLRRVVVAIVGALATFCVVAMVIYYKMADVAVNGFRARRSGNVWRPRWLDCSVVVWWRWWC